MITRMASIPGRARVARRLDSSARHDISGLTEGVGEEIGERELSGVRSRSGDESPDSIEALVLHRGVA